MVIPDLADAREPVIIAQNENVDVSSRELDVQVLNINHLETPISQVASSSDVYEQQIIPLEQEETNVVLASEKGIGPKPKSKMKSRKKKFKPTLVTVLKLDANGEMVLDYTSTAKLATNGVASENLAAIADIIHQPTDLKPTEDLMSNELFIESKSTETQIIQELDNATITRNEILTDENLNEKDDFSKKEPEVKSIVCNDEPSTSSNSPTEFDEEAFLDSLDLEKLVMVEANRNGKDVYEIHEIIDPITQEISDKPLELPSRIVDLILSVMSQHEDDDK